MTREDIESALAERGMKLDSRGEMVTITVRGKIVEAKASRIQSGVNTGDLSGLYDLVEYGRARQRNGEKKWQDIDFEAMENLINSMKR